MGKMKPLIFCFKIKRSSASPSPPTAPTNGTMHGASEESLMLDCLKIKSIAHQYGKVEQNKIERTRRTLPYVRRVVLVVLEEKEGLR